MRFIRHTFYIAIISVMATVSVFSGNVYGRSLYAITNCQGGTLTAYGIQGDQIVYQINTQIDTWAIGLALDPESETLFVAYDGSDKLVLVDAKTMTQIKSISTTDELAGIVFDVSKQRVYAVSREDRFLYVYLWNPITKTLIQDGEPKILGDADFDAFGVVFDEEEKTLYVTDTTNQVKYYDADDPNFGYLGSIDITVDSNDRETVGIDFYKDSQGNKYLYTGAWMHSTQHEYLVRTDINDVNNPVSTERYLGSNVGAMGVAVDQQTGYVYVTTSNNHIEVYNHTTFPTDPCWTDANNISGPADIIVRGDVSYKPPLLTFEKTADINDANCVIPGDYITYTITYNANGHSVTDLNIIDYLPDEIDIIDVNASDGGTYDMWKRTVTWEIGPLDSNDSGFVTVTIKVDERAEPNSTITNYCEMESDSTYNTAEVNTPVCYWCGDIIYVDVNAPTDYNTGASWQYAYKDLQNALQDAPWVDTKNT